VGEGREEAAGAHAVSVCGGTARSAEVMLQPHTGIAANKRLTESPPGARCRSGAVATGMRGPNKQGGARRLQRRLGQRSLVLLSAAAKSRNADLGLSAGRTLRRAPRSYSL
jgi:hypothetical protein